MNRKKVFATVLVPEVGDCQGELQVISLFACVHSLIMLLNQRRLMQNLIGAN